MAEQGKSKADRQLGCIPVPYSRNAVFRYIERSLLFKNYQSRQLSDDNSDLYEIESELNAKELELIIASLLKECLLKEERFIR